MKLQTPGEETDRSVHRYECPHEARAVASRLNKMLQKNNPSDASEPFDFYFVGLVKNREVLPWLARVACDEGEMRLDSYFSGVVG